MFSQNLWVGLAKPQGGFRSPTWQCATKQRWNGYKIKTKSKYSEVQGLSNDQCSLSNKMPWVQRLKTFIGNYQGGEWVSCRVLGKRIFAGNGYNEKQSNFYQAQRLPFSYTRITWCVQGCHLYCQKILIPSESVASPGILSHVLALECYTFLHKPPFQPSLGGCICGTRYLFILYSLFCLFTVAKSSFHHHLLSVFLIPRVI